MNQIFLQAGGQNSMMPLILMGAMILVFYFFMIRPQAQKAKKSLLFNDFQNSPFSILGRSRRQNRSDGLGCPAVLADDFSQILFGNTQLNNRRLLPLDLTDRHCIGIVNKSLSDVQY